MAEILTEQGKRKQLIFGDGELKKATDIISVNARLLYGYKIKACKSLKTVIIKGEK